MKNHSWLFCYLSHKKKKTKTSPRIQPHKIVKHLGFCTAQITLTDFFFIPGERKAAELAHGTGAVFPSLCSSPRAPQIETAIYTRVWEHTLPVPLGAHSACRANAQPGEKKEKGTRCSEQEGSTSPSSSPTQLLQDWHSLKEVAVSLTNPHKTVSTRPQVSATCTVWTSIHVFKKGNE